MSATLSLAVAIASLCLSVATAWLTLFRRGAVRMTQPTTIYFGPDGGARRSGRSIPKIYLRSLLYSTAVRGQVVECMFVRIKRGETTQNFNIWVYKDHDL